ncbi:LPD29 domain-containing protein [Escherichia coli]|uniref:LPD29 domain-containing protein n=1 Tax=Escherichia coli TaxID=562 RepID=UPI00156C4F6D|nr:LPD29 domain-containing protein [Escherichia coli]
MMNVKSVTEVDDAVVARVSEVLEFAFPGQKFEVLKVCDSGVYNMINVYWLDSPTQAEVRFITRAFEGKNGLRFVHESREFSNEFVQECIDRLRQKYGHRNVPPEVTVERYWKNDLWKIKTDRFPGTIEVAINEMGMETSKYRKVV